MPPTAAPGARHWRRLLVALGLVIAWLALTPAPDQRLSLGWDKLNHLSAFAALGLCAVLGYRGSRRAQWAALAGVLAFGALIEVLQQWVPNRSAEWADLLADALGIAVGALLAHAWLRRRGATAR